MGFCLSLCGFGLFFLSDYNDWRLGRKGLKLCFPLGVLLLALGTVLEARQGTPLVHGWLRGLLFALGALFFLLEIYTLFFALPVGASYASPGEGRPACTTGVYALCRHPGVLWFAGLYGCLALAAGLPLWEAAALSALNVGLVVFEDRCVFPARLEGYGAYQAATPFLVPNRASIRACWKIK